MSTATKSTFFATVCLLLCVSPLAVAADEKIDLSGNYRCAGTNPGGGQYSGTVKIVKHNDSYRIQWAIGSESYAGAGILDGDTFSVGWLAGGVAGVVSYKLQPDKKTLVGKWTVLGGDGKTMKETLTR